MIELRGRQFEPRLLDAFVGSRDEIAAIGSAYPDRDDEPRVRVLVVDDHEVFVQRLVRLLRAQPTINVVGCAATARDAEKAAVAHEPDVVLMDFVSARPRRDQRDRDDQGARPEGQGRHAHRKHRSTGTRPCDRRGMRRVREQDRPGREARRRHPSCARRRITDRQHPLTSPPCSAPPHPSRSRI